VQGYLLSRPISTGEIGDLLRNGLKDFVDALPPLKSGQVERV
jgi:hypothetical protein